MTKDCLEEIIEFSSLKTPQPFLDQVDLRAALERKRS